MIERERRTWGGWTMGEGGTEKRRRRGLERKKGGRDLDKREGIYCHTCEYLPTHILRVSVQLETWSRG